MKKADEQTPYFIQNELTIGTVKSGVCGGKLRTDVVMLGASGSFAALRMTAKGDD